MNLYEILNKFFNLNATFSLINVSIFAFLTSLFLMLILGNPYIRLIKKTKQMIQPIRSDGPQTHLVKHGTPTLGGFLIIITFIFSTLLWVDRVNNLVAITLFVIVSFAIIGLIDDLLKLFFKNTKGLSGKLRLFLEFIISILAIYGLMFTYPLELSHATIFPFVKIFSIDLGIFIYVFSAFVIMGSANGLNLTDGLDGLASWVSAVILTGLILLIVLIISPSLYVGYAKLGFLKDNGGFYMMQLNNLIVLISALVGSIIGFLWFNSYPAKIFMGDVGSLGIGSAIGIIVVILKHELFLILAGIILIVESLSVIIQVYYYKATKKRIFLMAPIHHHYEKKGYRETTIVNRMLIITIIFVLLAISLLDF
jgi:phospho-N-acetylmuramoyl-pentapeptide-transferase